MRYSILLVLILVVACNRSEPSESTTQVDTLNTMPDTLQIVKETEPVVPSKTYANERFKDVVVTRIDQDSFVISGQGQIFEANFNWVVEDGHDELMKGYHMTDAGAPEWGDFKFGIRAPKRRENSTLTLILFESSPKDGSRQHDLPIPLY